MRLRPFGDSGPLTVSGAFLDNYLQTHGRDWERYAWIKARAITGAPAWKLIHAESVRPFVYRRYLDFGVFESLREMKALIEKEVARRDLADHVKLGPGGIREIEFIVQAFQLIRGGQDRRMQTPSLLAVLPQLAGGKLLPVRVAQELEAAYLFLRRIENRLQMLGGCAESHAYPTDALTRERIAATMGFARWDACARRARAAPRARHPRIPGSHFRAARRGDGRDARRQRHRRGVAARRAGAAVRRGARRRAASPRRRRRRSCCSSSAARRALRRLDAPGRARLDTLLPRLLAAIADLKTVARGHAARCPAARAQGARSHRFALRVLRAAQRKCARAPQAGRARGARRIPRRADRLASAAARRAAG